MSKKIEETAVVIEVQDNVIPFWVAFYKGLPWKLDGFDRLGLNNWTFFRLVYSEQFGITLPRYLNYNNPQIFSNLYKNWNVVIYDDIKVGDMLIFGSYKDPIFAVAISKNHSLLIQHGRTAFIHKFDKSDLILAYKYSPDKTEE